MGNSFTNEIDDKIAKEDETSITEQINSKPVDLEIDSSSDKFDDDLIETREFKGKSIAIEFAGGAILGGLSIVFAVLVNPFMPTLPGLGIKIFDLIAIPMILAYIIFGIRSGLLATVIGCLGILILPESMAWVGMLAKFFATIPMIIIPWLVFKTNTLISKKSKIIPIIEETSDNLKKYYFWFMLVAILIRFILMFVLNLFVFVPLFTGGGVTIATNPQIALTSAIIYALWNFVQGTGDALIPFLLAYPTRFTKIFGTW